jgi:general secretion pathway protein G
MAATILGAIGLIYVSLVPNVGSRPCADKHQVAATTIVGFADACKAHKIQNRRWPETLEELTAIDQYGHRYLVQDTIPNDPWGHPYVYEAPTSGSTLVLISFGEDGEPGGAGSDRDVSYERTLGGEV